MLVIKRLNGKVMYAFDESQKVRESAPQRSYSAPIPIPQKNKNILNHDVWYWKHQRDIDTIVKLYLRRLYDFLKDNPRYTCSVNENYMQDALFEKLYKSSYSKCKTFP
jgi:hypothetical protein